MKRSLKIVAQGAMAALLASTSALPASASYLGYGNGDPGNWDLWQEQNGGKPLPSEDQQKSMAEHHLYYNSMSGTYEGPNAAHHAYHHAHRPQSKHG